MGAPRTRRSSRPTTSAGLYGEQIDGDVAELIGRAFARVLAELAGKPPAELRARARPRHAPDARRSWRRATATGMLAEGAHVLDAGQVGTEMVYYLVGSRELDGGLMCTASHNPKAYTGAKLVREGAIALSGDAGHRGHPPPRSKPSGASARRRRGGGQRRAGRPRTRSSSAAALRFIDPEASVQQAAEGRRRRRQRHGRPDGRAAARAARARAGRGLLDARRQLPRPRAQPAAAREPRVHHASRCASSGADLGIAWDGDADRCFFIDDTGEFVDGDFLTALLAESLLAQAPGATILYDVRASRAVADTVSAAGGDALDQPRRPRVLQDADARGGLAVRRRGLRPLLLPRLLLRRLGHDPGAADARAALAREGAAVASCSRPTARATSSPARSTPRSRTRHAKIEEIAERYADARQDRLDGISIDYDDWHFNVRPSNTEPLLRLCLESLVSPEDMERRRDEVLGADPLVSRRPEQPGAPQSRSRSPRAAGIHRLALPTPFLVGRVNAYLIEDEPLTLVDSGPELGKALDELEQALAAHGHAIEDLELIVHHPPAHGPPRPARDPRAPLRRRGRGARSLAPLPGGLRPRDRPPTTSSRRR